MTNAKEGLTRADKDIYNIIMWLLGSELCT